MEAMHMTRYALTSQADWQAGTLPPQVDATSSPGDLKLYRPTVAFARASVRNLPDGTPVASGQPGYWWGRWQNRWYQKDEWHTPADGSTQALYYEVLNPEAQPRWTISALIRLYADDGTVSPRISIIADYTDGTNTLVSTIPTKDGVERRLSATVVPTAGKTVWRVRGWVLDHSAGTANKHSDVRQIQLEAGGLTDWRPGGVKGGGVVEEGTTNLVPNPRMTQGLTGWYVNQNVSLSLVTRNGRTFVRCTTNQTGSSPGVLTAQITVTPNTTYTVSLLGKVSDAAAYAVFMYLAGQVSGNLVWATADIRFIGNDLRVTKTFTTGAADTWVKLGALFGGPATTGGYFEITDVQLEPKSYATSVMDGTRAVETLTSPTTGMSTNGPWTVHFWGAAGFSGINYRVPFAIGAGSGIGLYLDVSLDIANKPRVSFYDGAVYRAYSAAVAVSNPTSTHRWVLTYNGTRVKLYVDGALVVDQPGPIAGTLAALAYWGKRSDGYPWNGWLDDCGIETVVWDQAKVTADYNATSPMVPGPNTLALFRCDGSLVSDYPSQATMVTKPIYIGAGKTKPLHVWKTATTPAGTAVTIDQVRTGPDGFSWGAWAPLNGSFTPWVPEAYLQFRVTPSATDPTQTPVLSDLTAMDWNPVVVSMPAPIQRTGIMPAPVQAVCVMPGPIQRTGIFPGPISRTVDMPGPIERTGVMPK